MGRDQYEAGAEVEGAHHRAIALVGLTDAARGREHLQRRRKPSFQVPATGGEMRFLGIRVQLDQSSRLLREFLSGCSIIRMC